jgi:hypothetical protein
MDPLSVAASIVSLATFCVDVGNYLAGVRNAPRSAERLGTQVSSLRHVLEQLAAFLRGESVKGKKFAKTSALVQSTEVCKCQLLRVLEKLEKVNKNILHRVTFPLNEKEINQSIEVLRGCAQTFQFSLTIDGW